jgi:hypothetical protein
MIDQSGHEYGGQEGAYAAAVDELFVEVADEVGEQRSPRTRQTALCGGRCRPNEYWTAISTPHTQSFLCYSEALTAHPATSAGSFSPSILTGPAKATLQRTQPIVRMRCCRNPLTRL